MAKKSTGYFDNRGNFHETAQSATVSDIAALMGHVGEDNNESLAPGIARFILERRAEIERIYSEHDELIAEDLAASGGERIAQRKNVTAIKPRAAVAQDARS